jgi:uncharacterized protein (TIGR02246 family)
VSLPDLRKLLILQFLIKFRQFTQHSLPALPLGFAFAANGRGPIRPFSAMEFAMTKLLAVVVSLVLTVGCAAVWSHSLLGKAAEPPQGTDAQKTDRPVQAAKAADEKAILEMVYQYKEAFNRGDAETIAKQFTEHAELVDDAGESVQGRAEIRKLYEALFKKAPGASLEIHLDWFRWVSPDVVIGQGKAKVTPKNGAGFSTSYTAVHARRDGQWPIVLIRESVGQAKESKTREQSLQELEFLVGDFVDSDDSGTLKIHGKWSRNKSYLVRSFMVTSKDDVVLEGTETIGWDPARSVLRSWVFDTNGGFAEGTWKHKGKSWYCTLAGVQADGKKASAVHIFTPQQDHYTFQSIGRTLDGEVQPDIDEVKVRRVAAKTDK